MVLDGYQSVLRVREALNSAIIEVQLTDFEPGRQRVRIDRIPVILRRDVHASVDEVTDRVIPSMMPEFQLEGAATQCPCHNLMSKTYRH